MIRAAGFAPGVRRRLAIGLSLAALVMGLDQLSKAWVLRRWPEAESEPVPIIPTLDLRLLWNRGISFSMANHLGDYDRVLFGALSLLVSLFLVLWMARGAKPLILAGLGCIVGGALGNGLDRVRVGAVEDFLFFHVGDFAWPVFNIGDSAICIGAALMIFDSLFDRPLSHKNTP